MAFRRCSSVISSPKRNSVISSGRQSSRTVGGSHQRTCCDGSLRWRVFDFAHGKAPMGRPSFLVFDCEWTSKTVFQSKATLVRFSPNRNLAATAFQSRRNVFGHRAGRSLFGSACGHRVQSSFSTSFDGTKTHRGPCAATEKEDLKKEHVSLHSTRNKKKKT